MEKNIALIGLGVIGAPIAHILRKKYKDNFYLIATQLRKSLHLLIHYKINNEEFAPKIISSACQLENEIDLIIVCVKNYQLDGAIEDIAEFVGEKTVILPLQNGLCSYDCFCEKFSNNIILKGYIQGPNTEFSGSEIVYKNSGEMHIGDEVNTPIAIEVYNIFNDAGFPVIFENNINYMVWKKWMLNVAGNSVTALTNADYSMFKNSLELQNLCRKTMEEFCRIAACVGVELDNNDIDDVINYYLTYKGGKKTSMLVDVENKRKTENDYLAGYAFKIAKKYNIDAPMIYTLYNLIAIKENIYRDLIERD